LVDKYSFIAWCKKFEVDENEVLYLSPVYTRKYRNDRANHRRYRKTFAALSEKHIGITQQNMQEYINGYTTCSINNSFKKKKI
ncbi:45188_t:CDS:1, partial [Gigaspora margarita]